MGSTSRKSPPPLSSSPFTVPGSSISSPSIFSSTPTLVNPANDLGPNVPPIITNQNLTTFPSTTGTAAPNELSNSIFPDLYSFPPFFTRQPNPTTYSHQRSIWSAFILSYCKSKRIYRLNISEALESELFWNKSINRRLSAKDAVEMLNFMADPAGGGLVEWLGSGGNADGEGNKAIAIIYWKKPDEWANTIYNWIDSTGQRGSVLTLYEITNGDLMAAQEFYGLDPYILRKALDILVKRGVAQVFSIGDESGVKFF